MIEGIANGFSILEYVPDGWPLVAVVAVLAANGLSIATLRFTVALVLVSGIVMKTRQPYAEKVAWLASEPTVGLGSAGGKLAERVKARR